MTSREVYEGVLIEGNGYGAPEVFIDDFNYFINKSIRLVTDDAYKVFEETQEIADILQILRAPKLYTATGIKHIGATSTVLSSYGNATIKEAKYTVKLPSDYYHMLNCILTYNVTKPYRCYNQGYKILRGADRLKTDRFPKIMDNAWLRPSWKKPYYTVLANLDFDSTTGTWKSASIDGNWTNNAAYDPAKVKAAIYKPAGNKDAHNAFNDANANSRFDSADTLSGPTLEINYGKDASIFELNQVDIVYVRVPALVRLTPELIDSTEDLSPIMEFPDTVCQRIIQTTALLIAGRSNPALLQQQVVQSRPQTMQQQQAAQQQ